jgi:hypothetical protein
MVITEIITLLYLSLYSSVAEDSSVVGCDTLSLGKWFLMFSKRISEVFLGC